MTDYKQLFKVCKSTGNVVLGLIDDYLISYAGDQHNLASETMQKLNAYKHALGPFDSEVLRLFRTQFIAHKIFEEDGLLPKLLKQRGLKHLDMREQAFLHQQLKTPWRFSFSTIIENPAPYFYVMEDVFRHEEFLIYSPGIHRILKDSKPLLWFNLIGYNGECWQSYGPIAGYKCFNADDIDYFATELNPAIDDDEDIVKDVEKNPIPYMMLLSGSGMFQTFHEKDEILLNIGEYDCKDLEPSKLKKDFDIDYKEGVYRLGLKKGKGFPHFSTIYYDTNESRIFFYSLTLNGYEMLVEKFNDYGYNYDENPDINIHLGMRITAEKILKRKLVLNKYEALFD